MDFPFDIKRACGAAGGVVLGVAFVLLCPDVGLSAQGVTCLGILLGAIVWWVASVLPEYATGLLMLVMFSVFAGVETPVAFSSFSSGTWWLLVGGFALGAGMKRCGLMRRMALAILRLFPRSFSAQVAGLLAAGTVLGPLIPSMTAKAAILAPISGAIGEELGYEPGGKQMQGLFLSMLTGIRNVGPAVMSASIVGYALLGLLPDDVRAQFDMLHWFIAALPWFIVVMCLDYVALVLLYRPRGAASAAGVRGANAPEAPKAAQTEKTPMSTHEKQMLVIVIATVGLWVLEPLHGVATHIVGLAALVAMTACGILDKQAFRQDLSWESLVFMGTVFGLAQVFSSVGISEWIVQLCGPLFQQLSTNPYLFVLGIGVLTVLIRFVVVSEIAYINIVMVFMVPLAMSCGINPWVVGIAIYATVSPWFVMYQNPVYLTAFYAVEGTMARHADLAKFCAPYIAICMLGLLVSVPYWQLLGLL